VDGAIIDKHVKVGAGAVIGHGDDRWVVNVEEPDRLVTGITVVGKRAVIPEGARLGRNVRVDTDVAPEDLTSLEVPSGGTVHHPDGSPADKDGSRRRAASASAARDSR
jgi:glucose-1-phosphate adenylyltransferase